MNNAYIPYGAYWSTPFAKWQGSLGQLHSTKLAANVARDTLAAKKFPMEAIDLGILGITIPQPSSFFGLPWGDRDDWNSQRAGPHREPSVRHERACLADGGGRGWARIGGLRAHCYHGSLL